MISSRFAVRRSQLSVIGSRRPGARFGPGCRRRTTNGELGTDLLAAVLVAGADAGAEAPLLVGERRRAFALDLVEQLVHAAVFQFALLGEPGGLAGGPLLQPALDRPDAARLRGRRVRLLQARVALREVVAERRLLHAVL